jgi:hypothetical protein
MRSRWPFAIGALVIIALVSFGLVIQQHAAYAEALSRINLDGISSSLPGSASPRKGGVTHIVLLSFRSAAKADDMERVSKAMIALKDKCIHPITKKPYIRNIRGGIDNSPEDLNSHLTHAFVLEFDNPEHRDYYVSHDPLHKKFKEAVEPFVDVQRIVIDFTTEKYT